jgi:lipopolysaccharide export system protein LptA
MSQASLVPLKLLQASALLLLLAPAATWGLESDRSQPIHIEADKATLSEQGEKSIYEGNVQLRQGTLKLQGNRMTVYLANKQVDRILLTGEPATLQQRPNNQDADQHAQADSIEYSATDERVILLGNARIWQTGDEEFRSERIVFNLKDNTVNAGGKDSQDRVHITLQPKDKQASDNKNSEP